MAVQKYQMENESHTNREVMVGHICRNQKCCKSASAESWR